MKPESTRPANAANANSGRGSSLAVVGALAADSFRPPEALRPPRSECKKQPRPREGMTPMNAWLVRSVLFPWQERLKGKATYARLRELEQSQWLSPLALRELQFQQLHRHLEFAYREVPYYTRLLNEHELQPSKIHSLEDFSRIPCLTRQTIR